MFRFCQNLKEKEHKKKGNLTVQELKSDKFLLIKVQKVCFNSENNIHLRTFKDVQGKVKKIYPGKDGIVRVVEIKTKNGTFLRPVQRLYPLEVGEPGNFPFPGEESTPSVANGHSTRELPSVPDPVSTKTDHQDPLVRRSRYGRILKPTKT
ncbi:hypothetical protein TNIN_120321 [Trichonephila inaurata madagascariensis]|uniref:DUF5641 domain-containing protein n=1 Tax=Trichonephila inaurata madagascariensis TaxID=2747483 RepID=A0A8X6ID16_9ARAC|nr:hypothetical protein TNIN_120321 [Trichonephila inaurata madagascariensis]